MSLGRSASSLAIAGRRACAVLAAGSVALHAVMIGHAAHFAEVVLLPAMMVACLLCARHLWLDGTLRAWCLVGLMNLGMIAVHLSAPGHHHGAAVASESPPSPPSAVMAAATLVSAIEIVVAAAVMSYRTRHRTVALSLRRRELA
jgi:hypothetical protein